MNDVTTSQILWFTFVAFPLQVFEAFDCKVTILSAVGELHGIIYIKYRVSITMLVLFILLRLFISVIPIVSRYRTIVFDFLVSELLFVLLDFISSARTNALLSSVYVWNSLYLFLFILQISSSSSSKSQFHRICLLR